MELKIFTYLAHSSGETIGRNFKLGRILLFQMQRCFFPLGFMWVLLLLLCLFFVSSLQEVYKDVGKRKSISNYGEQWKTNNCQVNESFDKLVYNVFSF